MTWKGERRRHSEVQKKRTRSLNVYWFVEKMKKGYGIMIRPRRYKFRIVLVRNTIVGPVRDANVLLDDFDAEHVERKLQSMGVAAYQFGDSVIYTIEGGS